MKKHGDRCYFTENLVDSCFGGSLKRPGQQCYVMPRVLEEEYGHTIAGLCNSSVWPEFMRNTPRKGYLCHTDMRLSCESILSDHIQVKYVLI